MSGLNISDLGTRRIVHCAKLHSSSSGSYKCRQDTGVVCGGKKLTGINLVLFHIIRL
jgi:hypothetical protein